MFKHGCLAILITNLIPPLLNSCRCSHEAEAYRETRHNLIIQRIDAGADLSHRLALFRINHPPVN